jgi:hypothetical protein
MSPESGFVQEAAAIADWARSVAHACRAPDGCVPPKPCQCLSTDPCDILPMKIRAVCAASAFRIRLENSRERSSLLGTVLPALGLAPPQSNAPIGQLAAELLVVSRQTFELLV